jgi:hypothetical protein
MRPIDEHTMRLSVYYFINTLMSLDILSKEERIDIINATLCSQYVDAIIDNYVDEKNTICDMVHTMFNLKLISLNYVHKFSIYNVS